MTITACIRRVAAALIGTAALFCGARAAEYDGFLVKLDPGASTLERLPEMEEVVPDRGLWKAAAWDDVERLAEAGVLRAVEPNTRLTLGDPAAQLAAWDDDEDDEEEGEETPWYFQTLDIPYCRQYGLTGKGVRVGVLDSGLNTRHEEFTRARVLTGLNYCAEPGTAQRADTSDDNGHGTQVAGILAAAEDNGVGFAGIAPSIELVPMKCFDAKGNGDTADIVAAIYGAVDLFHCKVLNMSFSDPEDSGILREAIQYADAAGVILAAAASNIMEQRTEPDPMIYPASYPEAVSVGSLDPDGTASYFSARNESVWICAPGSDITTPSAGGKDDYVTCFGTSCSAPIVAGTAALALQAYPNLTPAEFRALLRQTALDRGAPGYDITYGYGALHTGAVLAALRGDIDAQAAALSQQLDADTAFAAAYDGEGKLLSVQAAGETLAVPEEARRWKLFLLQEGCPVRAPVALRTKNEGAV